MPPADQDRPFSTGTFNGEEFRVLPDQSAFNSLVAGQIDADGQLFMSIESMAQRRLREFYTNQLAKTA